MTVVVAPVGGSWSPTQVREGAGNTVSGTSAADTFAATDYVLVALAHSDNAGGSRTLSALTPSGGSLASFTKFDSGTFDESSGYLGRVTFALAKVTSGFTGTIQATGSAIAACDHWDCYYFAKITCSAGETLSLAQGATFNPSYPQSTPWVMTANLASAPAATSLTFVGLQIGWVGDYAGTSGTLTEVNETDEAGGFGSTALYADADGSPSQNNSFTFTSGSGAVGGGTAIVEVAVVAPALGGPSPVPQARRRYRRLAA